VSRKLASFLALPWLDRGLVAEAAIALAIVRLTLLLVPFRWYVRWLRRGGSRDTDLAMASRIGRAVRIAARNVPWTAVYLPQAMAAKAMLARRGYGSALYVGIMPSTDPATRLHAWLEIDGSVVAGGARSAVIPVVRFG
jgi:hypothetical protein